MMFRKGKTITFTKPVTAWRLVLDESHAVVSHKKVILKPGKFRVLGVNKKAKMMTVGFKESKRVWNVPISVALGATKRSKTESSRKRLLKVRKEAKRKRLGSILFLGESKDGRVAAVCERGSVVMLPTGSLKVQRTFKRKRKAAQEPIKESREKKTNSLVDDALDYGAAICKVWDRSKDGTVEKFVEKQERIQEARAEAVGTDYNPMDTEIEPELEAYYNQVTGNLQQLAEAAKEEADDSIHDPMDGGSVPSSAGVAMSRLKSAGYEVNISDEEWDQIKKMIDMGTTPLIIAKKLGVPVDAVNALVGTDTISAK